MFIFFRSFFGSFVCWFRCEPVLGFYRCSKAMPAMGMRMYIHISTREEIWWSVGMVSKSTLKWQSHGIKNSISTRFKLRVCENALSFFLSIFYMMNTLGPSFRWIHSRQPSRYIERQRWCTLPLIHVCRFYNCQWWSTLSRPTQLHSLSQPILLANPATNQPIIVLNSYAVQEM